MVGYIDSWQGISGIASGLLSIVCFVIFGISFFYYRNGSEARQSYYAWVLFPLTFAIILLIYATAALSEVNLFWLIILAVIVPPILILFCIAYVYQILNRPLPARLAWLDSIWTLKKGFGGTIYGDFGNAVGALSGVGAFAANPVPTWWWVAHMGAFLAILVGFSLLLRWMQAETDNEYDLPRLLAGLFNLAVGSFTLMSIMVQDSTVAATKTIVHKISWGLYLAVNIVWWAVLFLLLILAIIALVNHLRNLSNPARRYKVRALFVWIGAILLFIAAMVLLGLTTWKVITDVNVAKAFGMAAAAFWIGAEVLNIVDTIRSRHELKLGSIILTSEKSILEVIGAGILIIFTIITIVNSGFSANNGFVMVIVGVIVAGIGTFFGIIAGIVSIVEKRIQRIRVTQQQFTDAQRAAYNTSIAVRLNADAQQIAQLNNQLAAEQQVNTQLQAQLQTTQQELQIARDYIALREGR